MNFSPRTQDNILMAIREEDGEGTAGAGGSRNVVYVMHPNCAVEEI